MRFSIFNKGKNQELEDLPKGTQEELINNAIDIYNMMDNVPCTLHGINPKRITVFWLDAEVHYTVLTCCRESRKLCEALLYGLDIEVTVINLSQSLPLE